MLLTVSQKNYNQPYMLLRMRWSSRYRFSFSCPHFPMQGVFLWRGQEEDSEKIEANIVGSISISLTGAFLWTFQQFFSVYAQFYFGFFRRDLNSADSSKRTLSGINLCQCFIAQGGDELTHGRDRICLKRWELLIIELDRRKNFRTSIKMRKFGKWSYSRLSENIFSPRTNLFLQAFSTPHFRFPLSSLPPTFYVVS